MLNGLLLPSGNDAAIALAQRVSGTVPRFVALMNRRARAMGLTCTRFAAPDGFTDRGNHSCSADLAALARAVLREPRLARIVRRRQVVLPFPIKGGKLYLYNHNPLLRQGYRGVTGIKTGYTVAAGRCLVATVRRGQVRLGVVLLHSPDPGTQARKLLDRGFRLARQLGVVEDRWPRPPLSPAVYRRRRVVAVLARGSPCSPSRRCSLRGGGERRAAGERRAPRRPRRPRRRPSSPAAGAPAPRPPDRRVLRRPAGGTSSASSGSARPASAARRLARQARAYRRPDRPGAAGDGADRGGGGRAPGGGRPLQHAPDRRGHRPLPAAARRAKALLILDIQPGRSDFYHGDGAAGASGSRSPTSASRSTRSGGWAPTRCRAT